MLRLNVLRPLPLPPVAFGQCGAKNIAQSIVSSGGYEHDVDGGDTLEYTGEGGNDWLGSKVTAAHVTPPPT